MNKPMLLALLLHGGLALSLHAQTNTDSLEARLAQVGAAERIDVLLALAMAYERSNPAQAVAYGREAPALLRTFPDAEREADVLYQKGRAHRALEEAHTERKATQAQLIQQEKLPSPGRLTAGIAHEIKNPLNFVNNFARLSVDLASELMETIEAGKGRDVADVADDFEEILGDLRANTERIARHGRRADGIVRSMMEHASGGKGRRRVTDVNALVEEIRVCDNGPGIAPDVRERIFEPFFTTKPAGVGTGLGLSLSYDIVRHGHGGTLAVESGDGRGATFVLGLPHRR